ncbi:MAG: hypothetical protein PHD37_03900 [Gallionellaceae bacterium]|nr:hypothetical protein [Gallionellaceae bacterium]
MLQRSQLANQVEDCLIDVVNRGGDADTTGAVYGMAGLPGRWLSALDPVIRHACATRAEALAGL